MTFEEAEKGLIKALKGVPFERATRITEAADLYAQTKAAKAWEEGFTQGYSTGTLDDIMNKSPNPYKK